MDDDMSHPSLNLVIPPQLPPNNWVRGVREDGTRVLLLLIEGEDRTVGANYPICESAIQFAVRSVSIPTHPCPMWMTFSVNEDLLSLHLHQAPCLRYDVVFSEHVFRAGVDASTSRANYKALKISTLFGDCDTLFASDYPFRSDRSGRSA